MFALLFKISKLKNISWSRMSRLQHTAKVLDDAEMLMLDSAEVYTALCRKCGFTDTAILRNVKNNPQLKLLTEDDVSRNIAILNEFSTTKVNFSRAAAYPKVLTLRPFFVERRAALFAECGIKNVDPKYIHSYGLYYRGMSISMYQKTGVISHFETFRKLLNCFGKWPNESTLPKPLYDKQTTLHGLRYRILKAFLTVRFNFTPEQSELIICKNKKFTNTPFASIAKTIKILQDECKYTDDHLIKNIFVLGSIPANTERILKDKPTVSGVDVRWIIRNYPVFLMCTYENVIAIEEILQKYDIPLHTQRVNFSIYSLNPDTVVERLEKMKEYPEFQSVRNHPRYLSLIIHFNKAIARVESYRSGNKSCTTVFGLCCSRSIFKGYDEKFGDEQKGFDPIFEVIKRLYPALKRNVDKLAPESWLSKPNSQNHVLKNLGQYEEEILDDMIVDKEGNLVRKSLSETNLYALHKVTLKSIQRHKFWSNTTSPSVVEALEYLMIHFSHDAIVDNLTILLYPLSKIKEYLKPYFDYKLGIVRDDTPTHYNVFSNVDMSRLSDSAILALMQYEIEKNHYFSGNGIWQTGENIRRDQLSEIVEMEKNKEKRSSV